MQNVSLFRENWYTSCWRVAGGARDLSWEPWLIFMLQAVGEQTSGHTVGDHFVDVNKMVQIGSGGNQDFALIRSKGDHALFGKSTQAMKAQWKVVVYKGKGRVETLREQVGAKGYASGFEGLVGFINNLLPVNEVIGRALRKAVPVYPELAIRELVANALIHQDLSVSGSGPMVEIFDDRMEITNPGVPLVDPSRMLDSPPRSRNERLASLMRRMGICEERGSGVDKVVFQTEFYQLPAPAFEVTGDSTRSTLFAPRALTKMEQGDRVRAVYLHACLRYVEREFMTNTTLRERFGIDAKNSATASRLIKEALGAGVIRLQDPNAPPKTRRYLPHWA